jgi:hypothetical protein
MEEHAVLIFCLSVASQATSFRCGLDGLSVWEEVATGIAWQSSGGFAPMTGRNGAVRTTKPVAAPVTRSPRRDLAATQDVVLHQRRRRAARLGRGRRRRAGRLSLQRAGPAGAPHGLARTAGGGDAVGA